MYSSAGRNMGKSQLKKKNPFGLPRGQTIKAHHAADSQFTWTHGRGGEPAKYWQTKAGSKPGREAALPDNYRPHSNDFRFGRPTWSIAEFTPAYTVTPAESTMTLAQLRSHNNKGQLHRQWEYFSAGEHLYLPRERKDDWHAIRKSQDREQRADEWIKLRPHQRWVTYHCFKVPIAGKWKTFSEIPPLPPWRQNGESWPLVIQPSVKRRVHEKDKRPYAQLSDGSVVPRVQLAATAEASMAASEGATKMTMPTKQCINKRTGKEKPTDGWKLATHGMDLEALKTLPLIALPERDFKEVQRLPGPPASLSAEFPKW